MEKTEVIVDTEFIHKLSSKGKNVQEFKKVLEQLEFYPVVHSYVAKNELGMFSYFNALVNEGYIRVVEYEEYLIDESDRKLYGLYFQELHDTLRKDLQAIGGRKQLPPLVLPDRMSIFEFRKAEMSLGDVHMILMASFMQIPVILSDDSDMEKLKRTAKSKFSYDGYELNIWNCVEVLEKIAMLKESNFTKGELLDILKHVGENKSKSVIKQAWNSQHT